MSSWEVKAVKNQKAAGCLIERSLFSSSVHCSYYSNVQLILHIFLVAFSWTESQIELNRRRGSREEKGFHNWIEREIKQSISNKDIEKKEKLYIIRNITKLKVLRVDADYKNILIDKNKSKDAFEISKKIKEILTKTYLS